MLRWLQMMEINDVRCSKKDLKQVQSILKKNFKLSLKVRSNLPGAYYKFIWPFSKHAELHCRVQELYGRSSSAEASRGICVHNQQNSRTITHYYFHRDVLSRYLVTPWSPFGICYPSSGVLRYLPVVTPIGLSPILLDLSPVFHYKLPTLPTMLPIFPLLRWNSGELHNTKKRIENCIVT